VRSYPAGGGQSPPPPPRHAADAVGEQAHVRAAAPTVAAAAAAAAAITSRRQLRRDGNDHLGHGGLNDRQLRLVGSVLQQHVAVRVGGGDRRRRVSVRRGEERDGLYGRVGGGAEDGNGRGRESHHVGHWR